MHTNTAFNTQKRRECVMSKQGRHNADQTRAQIEKQDIRNDVELGNEFQIGNSRSQSQKKSGRQVNKK